MLPPASSNCHLCLLILKANKSIGNSLQLGCYLVYSAPQLLSILLMLFETLEIFLAAPSLFNILDERFNGHPTFSLQIARLSRISIFKSWQLRKRHLLGSTKQRNHPQPAKCLIQPAPTTHNHPLTTQNNYPTTQNHILQLLQTIQNHALTNMPTTKNYPK